MVWLCETAGGRWICCVEPRLAAASKARSIKESELTLNMTCLLQQKTRLRRTRELGPTLEIMALKRSQRWSSSVPPIILKTLLR